MINSKCNLKNDDIRRICKAYFVKELLIFGSATTENFTEQSDVDLLVEFQPHYQVGFIILARMQRELSETLRRPVDLVPKSGLKKAIRNTVLSSSEVLYAA